MSICLLPDLMHMNMKVVRFMNERSKICSKRLYLFLKLHFLQKSSPVIHFNILSACVWVFTTFGNK